MESLKGALTASQDTRMGRQGFRSAEEEVIKLLITFAIAAATGRRAPVFVGTEGERVRLIWQHI